MHALVTGASGFIGRHLVTQLLADDWQVTVSTRRPQAYRATSLTVVTPQDVAFERGYDTVFHVAGIAHEAASAAERAQLFAFNRDATVELFRAAAAADVNRFVWLSSSKVLGDMSTQPLTANAPLHPVGAYAESKAQAETALLDTARKRSCELAIVRPPLVYGAGVSANFAQLLKAIDRGYVMPLGLAHALRSWVSVQELCGVLSRIGRLPHLAQTIWHVKDPQDLSVRQMLERIGAAFDKQPRLVSVPPRVVGGALRLLGRGRTADSLFASLQLDDRATRAEIHGYVSYDAELAIADTVAWYQTHS